MSLQKLLAEFPNYSARKVRRLAKQANLLQSIAAEFALGEDTGLLKGIEVDLMDYNLLMAETERQMNDDLKEESPKVDVEEEAKVDRVQVTPVSEARRALQTVLEWMRVNTDANMKSQELNELVAKCQGMVYGQSFYADRTVIQARMGKQETLELESARGDAS